MARYPISYPRGLHITGVSLECVGKRGAFIRDLPRLLEHTGRSDLVIIDIGTNDLCAGVGGKVLAKKVLEFAQALDTRSCVNFILPRTKSPNHFDKERKLYNAYIEANAGGTVFYNRMHNLVNAPPANWSRDGMRVTKTRSLNNDTRILAAQQKLQVGR